MLFNLVKDKIKEILNDFSDWFGSNIHSLININKQTKKKVISKQSASKRILQYSKNTNNFANLRIISVSIKNQKHFIDYYR